MADADNVVSITGGNLTVSKAADAPRCESSDCDRPADWDVMLDGENGCFEGKLCGACYDCVVRILRPRMVSAAFMHIITIEQVNAALVEGAKDVGR